MNKKNIEKMIPIAMDILNDPQKCEIVEIKGGVKTIESKYCGYIASMGPTIIQSGLCQALAFNDKKDTDRKKINDLLKDVLIQAKPERFPKNECTDLFYFIEKKIDNKNSSEKHIFQTLILEAITACKLAMRTFDKVQSKGE